MVRNVISKMIIALLVLISLGLIAFAFSLVNTLLLVPWDTALTRPEIGTWQRTVNDFFEGRIGETILFVASCFMFGIAVVNTLRKRWDSALRVVVANLLFFFGGWFTMMFAFTLNNIMMSPFLGEFDAADPFWNGGYIRSIFPMIIAWVLYALWFREMRLIGQHTEKQKNKAKTHNIEQATYRLSDQDARSDTVNLSQGTVAHEGYLAQK